MKLKNTLLASAVLGCTSAFFASGASACTGVLDNQTNAVGTHNGYYYSFWRQTSNSNVRIGCGEGGSLGADIKGIVNFVASTSVSDAVGLSLEGAVCSDDALVSDLAVFGNIRAADEVHGVSAFDGLVALAESAKFIAVCFLPMLTITGAD